MKIKKSSFAKIKTPLKEYIYLHKISIFFTIAYFSNVFFFGILFSFLTVYLRLFRPVILAGDLQQ
jgi:hypothetical protein